MKCIVPLAGPDFYLTDHGPKALHQIDGEPLVGRALRSRTWVRSGDLKNSDLVFILREGPQVADVSRYLESEFPGARRAVINDVTRGALASSLAGVSLLSTFSEPLLIDLVDIFYDCDVNVADMFRADPGLAGLIPYFVSDSPKYSYLELKDGRVRRTREKEVISTHASAGTYFFRDASALLRASAESLTEQPKTVFVCPAYNTLIQEGEKVLGIPVANVRPILWPPMESA